MTSTSTLSTVAFCTSTLIKRSSSTEGLIRDLPAPRPGPARWAALSHRLVWSSIRVGQEFEHAAKVNELYNEGGLQREKITNEEIGKIEPALAGGHYLGGYFTPSDFTGDIHRYTVGLADGIEKEGVQFKVLTYLPYVLTYLTYSTYLIEKEGVQFKVSVSEPCLSPCA